MAKIRPFKREDLNAVLALANRYAAFDGRTKEADLAATPSFPNGFLVAEERGGVVGFAFGYLREVPAETLDKWKANKVGQLALMAVDPDYRRRGIGTSLFQGVQDALKLAGVDLVLLDCPSEAVEAKKLYEKLGFEVRAHAM